MTQTRNWGNRTTEFVASVTRRKIKIYVYWGKAEQGADVRSWDEDVALSDSNE